jgi:hypothetical protein
MNIRHEIFRLIRASHEVIVIRLVLMYYVVEIVSHLFLSGSFGVFLRMFSELFSPGFLVCPQYGSIISIYSREDAL